MKIEMNAEELMDWLEKYCPNEFEITNEEDGTLTLFFSTRVTEG